MSVIIVKRERRFLSQVLMSNELPDYSVLMSVYIKESPKFFEESLKSIQRQTIQPKELILVKDGPISSQLQKIIYKYQKVMNIIEISLMINKGLGVALRIGSDKVSTDWILRMDSDDISVDNRAELQLKEIIKNPNTAVIGGQLSEFIGNPNNIVGHRIVPLTKNDIAKFIKYRSPFNHPTVMINKNILSSVGGYEEFERLEDYFLWIKIVSAGYEVKNLPDNLLYMRVGDDLYQRRAGLKYLKQYFKLRNYMRNKNVINFWELTIADTVMTINVVIPNVFRKWIYQKMLHKKG